MKRRNVRTTLITLVLLLATASPLVSAANQSEEVSRQNVYSIDSTTILSFQDVLSSGSGVEALLCGYNLERTIRGDCDGTSATLKHPENAGFGLRFLRTTWATK